MEGSLLLEGDTQPSKGQGCWFELAGVGGGDVDWEAEEEEPGWPEKRR